MSYKTGYVYDLRYLLHDPGPFHPERPERLRAIHQRLEQSGLLAKLTVLSPEPAPLKWITTLHDPDYIERFQKACAKGFTMFQSADNGICQDSYDIALLAVGGVLKACDAVMTGEVDNAFCAIRPPGHHAERARAMGFCFFNNVALGACYLQEQHGLGRIAIVDWDVHHGNGTQHLFEYNPTVLYISTHEDPNFCYPGTGRKSERGKGPGEGYTLNFPFPPDSGDAEYLKVMREEIIPALQKFQPDFLLISAGFDAHADDPLAHIRLSREGYRQLGEALIGFARENCQGRVITVLEGGYNLEVLADCVADHIQLLLGQS